MKKRTAALCALALTLAACSSSEPTEDEQPAEQQATTEPQAAEPEPAPEPDPDEIPNAISTGTDIDNACADLPGAKFVSVEDMSGDASIDRAEMTFTDETYEWRYDETVRTGIYDCEGGRITGYADQGNQMRSGQYTPKNGRLKWRNMEFQMVSE
jgi:hypothetical protein